MSDSGRKGAWAATGTMLIACVALSGAGLAAEDELPDAEFLEYLGSWAESDEDWVLFSETGETSEGGQAATDEIKRIDPAPDGKESMESDDES